MRQPGAGARLRPNWQAFYFAVSFMLVNCCFVPMALAQTGPTAKQASRYIGLHAAAWHGNVAEIQQLAKSAGLDPNNRDAAGRTPLHVATFASHNEAIAALVKIGANPNLLENDKYDIITIAAVAGDAKLVALAIRLGGNPGNITSVYDGTALIAAAHLGHVEVVQELIKAGAPLDHVNNLGWTALIEAIVLGDGGKRHTETVRALVAGGANTKITDRSGQLPIQLATARGYREMVDIIQNVGK